MKGYYVIPRTDDPIEFTGKNSRKRAIAKMLELNEPGDKDVFVQSFDDDNPDGFFAGEEVITLKNYKEN